MLDEFIEHFGTRLLLRKRMSHLKGSTITYKKYIRLVLVHASAFQETRPILLRLASLRLPDGSDATAYMKLIPVKFLLDRVTATPMIMIRIAMHDPLLSAPSLGALARSHFEAAVNLLYLLSGNIDVRIASFFANSSHHEKRMHDLLEPYCTSDNPFIAFSAKMQRSTKDPPTDESYTEILQIFGLKETDIESWPTLRDRCVGTGAMWEYWYDARYRGLSAWQHGDSTRASVGNSLLLNIPKWRERTAFEAAILITWAWDIIAQLLEQLAGDRNLGEADQLISHFHLRCKYVAAESLGDAIQKFHDVPFGVILRDEATGDASESLESGIE